MVRPENQHAVDVDRRKDEFRRRGSAENEVSRVTVQEEVHGPGEGVLLIKSVTYDMARYGVNDFGQDTI